MTDLNNENANSNNGENSNQDLESLDATALKELVVKERTGKTELENNNRQLFERAKKAEGFEKDAEGNWIKIIERKPKDLDKKSDAKIDKKSEGIDFGKLAFHNTKSNVPKIEAQDDIDFLEKTLEETGKDQSALLSSQWFLAELKERQDKRTVEDATPKGSRGSGEISSTKPEYWFAKGELPPDKPENRELREKVVELRMKSEQGRSKFADVSVIG